MCLNGHPLTAAEAKGQVMLNVPGRLRPSRRNFVEIATYHDGLPESTVTITSVALTVAYGW